MEKIYRSFTSGEISPALRSRTDMNKYQTGLAKCENFLVRPQGGVYSRPGTRFIGEIGDSSKQARLVPFEFSTSQTYVLVFEENTIRFVREGAFILDGGVEYEIATPYLESELSRISFTQSADVMTITHPNHAPRDLSRLADTSWTLAVIDFTPRIDPPAFLDVSAFSITNITQADPAVVTTSAAHGFVTGDTIYIDTVVGMTEVNDTSFSITVLSTTTFELDGIDSSGYSAYTSGGVATRRALLSRGDGEGDYDKTYSYVVTAVNLDGEESIASEVRSHEVKSLSTTHYMLVSWRVVVGASYYRIYKAPSNNSGVYGYIGESKSQTFEDYNYAPITSDAPPTLRDPFTDLVGNITGLDLDSLTLTCVSHGLTSGDEVLIDGILQPIQFNGNTYSIQVVSDNTFRLLDTGVVGPLLPYTSGGTFLRVGQIPAIVSYYQQRRVFANTTDNPQTVYSTQTANYDSLRTSSPLRDDDAITFTIASNQLNEIRHIVSLDSLIFLTSAAEWKTTEGEGEVLTPYTIGVKVQSYNGASWTRPVVVDDSVIYVQNKGAKLRDLSYEFSADKYAGNDLSIMADHFFEGFQITEMAYADEPYGIVWCVRNDGVLLGLTYQREHQVWGWHKHTTNGLFESVTTVTEGDRDALYCVVNRTVGGSTVRYVERMEPRYVGDAEDCFCVDSGLTYDGAPATVISGLDHLEGEDVTVLADGNEVAGLTVSSGTITLPIEASVVQVGMSYLPVIETLDIDIASPSETLKASQISVFEVTIEILNSRDFWIGAKTDSGSFTEMREVKPRYDSDNYGAIVLKSGKEKISNEPEWGSTGGLRIEQRAPLPLAITSIIPDVDVGR